MTTRDDGGPAFPRPIGAAGLTVTSGEKGMSLREWYKGQALVGILSRAGSGDLGSRGVAELCAAFADAMLAERAKP